MLVLFLHKGSRVNIWEMKCPHCQMICHQTWYYLIPIQGSRWVAPQAVQTLGSQAPLAGSRSSSGAWMSQGLGPRTRAGQTCTRGCHSTHGRGTHYRIHPVLWGMWPIIWPAPAIGGWGKCPCNGRLYAGGTPFYFWGWRGALRAGDHVE